MALRATNGNEKPAGGEGAANEWERRGRFFRGASTALRATKVDEDRPGKGAFRSLFACSSTERWRVTHSAP